MSSFSGQVTLFLALLVSGACGKPCTNVIPGVYRQSRGIDVTRLDLLPETISQHETGYRSPVIALTCDKGRTRVLGGVTYNMPDQVWSVSNIPSGQLTSAVHIMRTTNEARNSFSVNAGVEVTTKKFAFSASTSFSKTQKTILKRDNIVQALAASFSARHVEFNHVDVLTLGPDAQREVNELPVSYTSDPSAYERFISQFGTHYMPEAKFGGTMAMRIVTNATYNENNNEQTVSAQASATFSSVLTIKGGTSVSNAQIDSTYRKDSTKVVVYYGGETNLMASDGLSKWQPTIDKNPWLFSTKLRRISDLIRDSNRKKAMSQAIDDHLMRTFLKVELVRVLKSLPIALHNNWRVTGLLNEIATMGKKYPLVESEVDALGKKVDSTFKTLLIDYTIAQSPFPWVNKIMKTANYMCPPGQVIHEIKSQHSDYHDDRWWAFKCTYPGNLYRLGNCKWSGKLYELGNYNWDYSCPHNGVVKGWWSEHWDKWNTRIHELYCCQMMDAPGAPSSCTLTENVNKMMAFMHVKYDPKVKYVNGVAGHHSWYYDDDTWKIRFCQVPY